MNKKSETTKIKILNTALNIASTEGLKGLTIGNLATALNMSKSGLFAHFNSKENLQIAVLSHAVALFEEKVIQPSRMELDYLKRLRRIADLWVEWDHHFDGSCIFVGAQAEFDDQPGRVRDYLKEQMRSWIEYLRRQVVKAQEQGALQPEVDSLQIAYEIYSLFLGGHLFAWLEIDGEGQERVRAGLDSILSRYAYEAKNRK